jgi:hypothetical protein
MIESVATVQILEALRTIAEATGGSFLSQSGAGIDAYNTNLSTTATSNGPVQRIDDTYDLITQGSLGQRICYPGGQDRGRSRSRRTGYRPTREVPLSREYCRCEHYDFEIRPHILEQMAPQIMRHYQTALENIARREMVGSSGPFDTSNGRDVVEQRQARATVGLDTSLHDTEIARRVLEDPSAWGWIGEALAVSVINHCQ